MKGRGVGAGVVEESSHEQAVFGLIVIVKQTTWSHGLARYFSHVCRVTCWRVNMVDMISDYELDIARAREPVVNMLSPSLPFACPMPSKPRRQRPPPPPNIELQPES